MLLETGDVSEQAAALLVAPAVGGDRVSAMSGVDILNRSSKPYLTLFTHFLNKNSCLRFF